MQKDRDYVPAQSRFESSRRGPGLFPNRPRDNCPVTGIRKLYLDLSPGLFWFTALLSLHASALTGHEILIHSPNITADESSPDHYEYSGSSSLSMVQTWSG